MEIFLSSMDCGRHDETAHFVQAIYGAQVCENVRSARPEERLSACDPTGADIKHVLSSIITPASTAAAGVESDAYEGGEGRRVDLRAELVLAEACEVVDAV